MEEQMIEGLEDTYNNQDSELLFKGRTKTLKLKDRNRRWQEGTKSHTCEAERKWKL